MNDHATDRIPLCVDLDGTLIHTDSLMETVALFIKQHFFMLFFFPYWLIRGRAYFKEEIASRTTLDVAYLPYQKAVLQLINKARANKREIILCTGANRRYADAVANHLGIFDSVMASDKQNNLSGDVKKWSLIKRFGDKGYDYVGNDSKDIPCFQHAHMSYIVCPTRSLRRMMHSLVNTQTLVPHQSPAISLYFKQFRIHQWLKNVLIFVALLASQRFNQVDAIIASLIAFLSFGFCASSVYVLNDLMDLPVDRRHPRKRERPFANGAIQASHGLMLAPLLVTIAFLLASLLTKEFIAVLFLYYFVTLNYNLWAKNLAVLDTLFLAGLYTLRIIAGAAAIDVIPSFWLLAFSMFFFLSVAMAKRYSELITLDLDSEQHIPGRQYRTIDLNTIISQGVASGYASVLVMALYINSNEVLESYSHPQIIWMTCPLLLYWINKLWLNTQRREMHDDPLVWAIENRVSRGIAIMFALLLILAI